MTTNEYICTECEKVLQVDSVIGILARMELCPECYTVKAITGVKTD